MASPNVWFQKAAGKDGLGRPSFRRSWPPQPSTFERVALETPTGVKVRGSRAEECGESFFSESLQCSFLLKGRLLIYSRTWVPNTLITIDQSLADWSQVDGASPGTGRRTWGILLYCLYPLCSFGFACTKIGTIQRISISPSEKNHCVVRDRDPARFAPLWRDSLEHPRRPFWGRLARRTNGRPWLCPRLLGTVYSARPRNYLARMQISHGI